MPIIVSDETRIMVPADAPDGREEELFFIFPPIDDPEFTKAIVKFLQGRWEVKGRGPKNTTTQARIRFFNETCLDCDSGDRYVARIDGKLVPINNKLPNWKRKVSPGIKASAASQFEERESLSAGERESLDDPSDEV